MTWRTIVLIRTFVLLGALLVTALMASAQNIHLTANLTNPGPATGSGFGYTVAAIGSDLMLIGEPFNDIAAVDAGAVHIFSTNGTWITTVTNPNPTTGDWFGYSVAACGADRVIIGKPYSDIGATDAGQAYLFTTSGVLLTTFTNPTPAVNDYFGESLAALGSTLILIGAPGDNAGGANQSGVVHLFATNGTLITTITNPAPSFANRFGFEVVAVGTDRLLVGELYGDAGATDAGSAHLFSTNGALLTTFTNPTPAKYDSFGFSLAALDSGLVIIGAYFDDTGSTNAGCAYLFTTNGTLVTTLTNPTPSSDDNFGYSVAAIGSDRLLVSSPIAVAGVAYLFNTNGTLLTCITNLGSNIGDGFGWAMAFSGDHILIGAPGGDLGATNAGAAYLFRLEPELPSLSISLTVTNTAVVSWPSSAIGFVLQQHTNAVEIGHWSSVTNTIHDDTTNRTHIINAPAGTQFYRLFKP